MLILSHALVIMMETSGMAEILKEKNVGRQKGVQILAKRKAKGNSAEAGLELRAPASHPIQCSHYSV